jgi:formyl-CoA transferase
MHAIDRSDLIEDDRFKTNERRLDHREELDEIIETWTRNRSTEIALTALDEHGAVAGPLLTIADIFEHEQYAARDDITTIEDPNIGEIATPNAIPKFSRTPGSVDTMAPEHDEHTREVLLEEYEVDEERYRRLQREGVIGAEDQ